MKIEITEIPNGLSFTISLSDGTVDEFSVRVHSKETMDTLSLELSTLRAIQERAEVLIRAKEHHYRFVRQFGEIG